MWVPGSGCCMKRVGYRVDIIDRKKLERKPYTPLSTRVPQWVIHRLGNYSRFVLNEKTARSPGSGGAHL